MKISSMYLLNVLNNETLHLVAEVMAIVVGSVLMGILLAYQYWGTYRKKVAQLANQVDFERNRIADLKIAINELTLIRDHLVKELETEKNKSGDQSRTVYEQRSQLYVLEKQVQEKEKAMQELKEELEKHQSRLDIISTAFEENEGNDAFEDLSQAPIARANYDHVSRLLGRQVIENDLTLISGIGLRTSSLLHAKNIETWEDLANTSVDRLRTILTEAGGMYRSLDPTHWPRQAAMAAHSEWRKLRVFQETLKKIPE